MFFITICNGYSTMYRGPFFSLDEAKKIFDNMPLGDDDTAYLEGQDGLSIEIRHGDDD